MLTSFRHEKAADEDTKYYCQLVGGTIDIHYLIQGDGSTHDKILPEYNP